MCMRKIVYKHSAVFKKNYNKLEFAAFIFALWNEVMGKTNPTLMHKERVSMFIT